MKKSNKTLSKVTNSKVTDSNVDEILNTEFIEMIIKITSQVKEDRDLSFPNFDKDLPNVRILNKQHQKLTSPQHIIVKLPRFRRKKNY